METTYGSLNPSNSVKLTWGIAQSAVALILLYSGGLQALQNAFIRIAISIFNCHYLNDDLSLSLFNREKRTWIVHKAETTK